MAEHGERVVRLLYGIVGDLEAAEDLAQDAFLRGFERWGQLDDEATATGWLYAIAVNNARQHLRRRSRWRHLPWQEGAVAASVEGRGSGEDDAGVTAVLSRLDPSDREVLLLIGIGELTAAEAAAALGISVDATYKRWQRARARFRRALEER